MAIRCRVLSNMYQDSVVLMRVASQAAARYRLEEAFAVTGTAANKEVLAAAGLLPEEGREAAANDLILAARGADPDDLERALDEMERELRSAGQGRPDRETEELPPRSLHRAVELFPRATVALVSTPGEFAAREAWKALHAGLHVHIFSDNVGLEDERALKEHGRQAGLLVMGPDCGTAYINGMPLGFANAVRHGPVGIVSAGGTGLQEVATLIHRAGEGISQGIGTGGRDLKDEIGGMTMCMGLEALMEHEGTRVIVLIAKVQKAGGLDNVLQVVRRCSKPVIAYLSGAPVEAVTAAGAVGAKSLEDAARQAVARCSPAVDPAGIRFDLIHPPALPAAAGLRRQGRRWVRALYTGGSLAQEAILLLGDTLPPLHSNLAGAGKPVHPLKPQGHAVIDFGEDELTRGRPHPMIDPTLRNGEVARALGDPEVLVVLLDVVLGFGAHPDPAGAVASVVRGFPPESRPAVVASVCGTDSDPQSFSVQRDRLRDCGVYVAPSNAAAVRAVRSLLQEGDRP